MARRFEGKTVVVTGASSGIGRASALEFARRGGNLVIAARRADRLAEVATLCRELGASCSAVPTDVTRRDDCVRLIESAGQVDVLVNNAGLALLDTIEAASEDDLHLMMDTNYFGTVHCTQAVLPQMLARGNGTIVNISSITGIMSVAKMGGYGATKAAIIAFTESLRDEVIGRGVRVALVCPATTETEFFETAERDKIPAAGVLIGTLDPERVARVVCASAADGRYRRILPLGAAAFMKFKEIAPALAHFLMRNVSRMLEK